MEHVEDTCAGPGEKIFDPVPAGAGAIFEFYIPEAGVFPFVDHDKLALLPFGLALALATEGVVVQVTDRA